MKAQKIGEIAKICVSALLALFFFVMIVASFGQVIFRYIIGSPLRGSEEVTRFLMVWVALIGGSVAFYYGKHLGVDLLPNKLPKGGQRIQAILKNILIAFFLSVVLKEGVDVTIQNMTQFSPALRIPMGWAYMALPVGSFLMLGVVIRNIVNLMRKHDEL